jgi:hypothetical protein
MASSAVRNCGGDAEGIMGSILLDVSVAVVKANRLPNVQVPDCEHVTGTRALKVRVLVA